MDPLHPIVPIQQSLIGQIPRTPGVPRVSPEQQRQQPREEQHRQNDADEEAAFEDLLGDTEGDGTGEDEPIVELGAEEEFFIPEVTRVIEPPLAAPPLEERRTSDRLPDGDNGDRPDDPPHRHIDISA